MPIVKPCGRIPNCDWEIPMERGRETDLRALDVPGFVKDEIIPGELLEEGHPK